MECNFYKWDGKTKPRYDTYFSIKFGKITFCTDILTWKKNWFAYFFTRLAAGEIKARIMYKWIVAESELGTVENS